MGCICTSLQTAVINLIDLAGSERVSGTGATGDRLKEGAAINQVQHYGALNATFILWGKCLYSLPCGLLGQTSKHRAAQARG